MDIFYDCIYMKYLEEANLQQHKVDQQSPRAVGMTGFLERVDKNVLKLNFGDAGVLRIYLKTLNYTLFFFGELYGMELF